MTAYWLPRARKLEAAGLTLSEIAAYVGRSKVTVWRQLRGRASTPSKVRARSWPRSAEERQRVRLRAAARAEAAETGEDVEALYARWDVPTVDRSLLWDLRGRAA